MVRHFFHVCISPPSLLGSSIYNLLNIELDMNYVFPSVLSFAHSIVSSISSTYLDIVMLVISFHNSSISIISIIVITHYIGQNLSIYGWLWFLWSEGLKNWTCFHFPTPMVIGDPLETSPDSSQKKKRNIVTNQNYTGLTTLLFHVIVHVGAQFLNS